MASGHTGDGYAGSGAPAVAYEEEGCPTTEQRDSRNAVYRAVGRFREGAEVLAEDIFPSLFHEE